MIKKISLRGAPARLAELTEKQFGGVINHLIANAIADGSIRPALLGVFDQTETDRILAQFGQSAPAGGAGTLLPRKNEPVPAKPTEACEIREVWQ